MNQCHISNGIVLIQVACSSYRCTLSCVYVHSVTGGHSELNEARVTNERRNKRRKERTHHVTLNLYIDDSVLVLGAQTDILYEIVAQLEGKEFTVQDSNDCECFMKTH